MADANTISAIRAGAMGFQATIGGSGERCGNANLFTMIADLTLKLGYDTIPKERIGDLYRANAVFFETANPVSYTHLRIPIFYC